MPAGPVSSMPVGTTRLFCTSFPPENLEADFSNKIENTMVLTVGFLLTLKPRSIIKLSPEIGIKPIESF